jgi:hypothetical protein
VVGGADFAFGIRSGAVEGTGAAAGANDQGHHHFPYARRLRLEWRHGAERRWSGASEDDRLWEVLCAECGDTDGPAERQAETVRVLRGPYSSEHKAKHVAKKHFDEN